MGEAVGHLHVVVVEATAVADMVAEAMVVGATIGATPAEGTVAAIVVVDAAMLRIETTWVPIKLLDAS